MNKPGQKKDPAPHPRRQALQRLTALAGGSAAALLGLPAFAQGYPARPLRIVVPWPAGGLVDVAARQLGTRLQAALGQPVVVENRVGAGGSIGADVVAKAPADGHTLLFSTSALTINVAMQTKLPFDLQRDFEPVCLLAHAPSVLVVGPSINPASVQELVALARARPGQLSYGSAGVGSPAHFAGELLKSLQKLFIVHIPYTGAPAAMNDQLAGRLDFQFANAAVALPQVRAGKVRALAVTGAQRFAALPQVPTMVEAGVANFEADQWLGLLAPRGLPGGVQARLAAECQKALAQDDLRAALLQAGMTAAPLGTPASFDAALKAELAKWTAVVKAANIKPE
ncbi:MAG: tripartite tricarboxylate transporter substrate binding protein [Betaproteobacteria bacterium]|jgi:tripartite-type tricarboxylate transporter receptor subunit TctC